MWKHKWWILTGLWILVIFAMSLMNGEQSGQLSSGLLYTIQQLLSQIGINFTISGWIFRKLAHFTEYAILGYLLNKSTANLKQLLIFAILVIICDESLQSFTPGRVMAITDMLIDFSGILLITSTFHWKPVTVTV